MSEKQFPYKGWVLTPGFKPVEKTFVSRYGYGWHDADCGKPFRTENIHEDKDSAIAWGREELERQQAALDHRQANIQKRRAALDKAAG